MRWLKHVGIALVTFSYISLGVALLASVGGLPSPIPPQPNGLPNVLFLGDSITQGQHTDDFTLNYTWQVIVGLRARSSQDAVQYLIDGVGGDSTGNFLGHLQAFDLHPSHADLIILELGTNDFLQNVPVATMQANYAAILARLVADNPSARLVALNVWSDPTAASAYNAVIAQEAATWTGSGGFAVVDISTLFTNPANHLPPGSDDPFHPGDQGHTAIAQAVLAAI